MSLDILVASPYMAYESGVSRRVCVRLKEGIHHKSDLQGTFPIMNRYYYHKLRMNKKKHNHNLNHLF
jgi:hypothetical protein